MPVKQIFFPQCDARAHAHTRTHRGGREGWRGVCITSNSCLHFSESYSSSWSRDEQCSSADCPVRKRLSKSPHTPRWGPAEPHARGVEEVGRAVSPCSSSERPGGGGGHRLTHKRARRSCPTVDVNGQRSEQVTWIPAAFRTDACAYTERGWGGGGTGQEKVSRAWRKHSSQTMRLTPTKSFPSAALLILLLVRWSDSSK